MKQKRQQEQEPGPCSSVGQQQEQQDSTIEASFAWCVAVPICRQHLQPAVAAAGYEAQAVLQRQLAAQELAAACVVAGCRVARSRGRRCQLVAACSKEASAHLRSGC